MDVKFVLVLCILTLATHQVDGKFWKSLLSFSTMIALGAEKEKHKHIVKGSESLFSFNTI